MNPTDQQIALCEWAGWKLDTDGPRVDGNGSSEGVGPKMMKWIGPDRSYLHPWCSSRERADRRLPNTNSLDVLHEMEKRLDDNQSFDFHRHLLAIRQHPRLKGTVAMHMFWENEVRLIREATAAQRREAMLKTLNLWREDSK